MSQAWPEPSPSNVCLLLVIAEGVTEGDRASRAWPEPSPSNVCSLLVIAEGAAEGDRVSQGWPEPSPSNVCSLLVIAEGATEGDRASQGWPERPAAEAVSAGEGTAGGAGTAEEGKGSRAQGTGACQAGYRERQVGECWTTLDGVACRGKKQTNKKKPN